MSDIITTGTTAEDVLKILADAGKGVAGVSLFAASEPDGDNVQDEVVTIYDTPAHGAPELNYGYEYPSVQVRVRGKPWQQSRTVSRVLQLMNVLHGYCGTVGDVTYHLIRVVNGPNSLGTDQRDRPRWTFNCEIQRSPSA